ncbi:MAG: MFS transporter [Gammaproteobacteria bacterium]|nr:MFS transporter [Gammaproteobacteria bacterium]
MLLTKNPTRVTRKTVLRFVILLGLISLLADITSNGARGIIGPYLGALGASATIVGFVAGFGELVSYGLRIVSGYIVELTGNYWTVAFIGYSATLIAVPLMAFAGHWEYVAMLLIIERMGKAMRSPARDTMLAHATEKIGRGWGFGLHKMLDQVGAMLGPLIVAVVLYFRHDGYQTSFLILVIPAVMALVVLVVTSRYYPRPRDLETKYFEERKQTSKSSIFWIYAFASALVAAGYADFPLIAFHFQKEAIFSVVWIPVLYSVALGVSGITAIMFGRWYDHNGYSVLILLVVLSSFFAPLVFLGGFQMAFVGMILWGIGMGSQISLMRAIIANMIPMAKRGSAYGIFNACYGIFWFLGSALMGVLYSRSIILLVAFSVVIQLASIPLFVAVKIKSK